MRKVTYHAPKPLPAFWFILSIISTILTALSMGYILQLILGNEIGSKEDYQKEFGDTYRPGSPDRRSRPVSGQRGLFQFLNDHNLDTKKIRFVKTFIDYIVKNGILEKELLQEEPFKSIGSTKETICFTFTKQLWQ